MAITDAYVSAKEYRDVTGKPVDSADARIDLDLKAISRYLERKLGRFFTVDASDQTRVYIPNWHGGSFRGRMGGRTILYIDDLSAAPTSIKIDKDGDGSFADETALATTDYELHPLNASLGPEATPYTSIVLTPWGDEVTWPEGDRVQIVGKWGWPAIPEAIKRATIEIAALLRIETPRATNRIPEGFGQAIESSPQAQQIIWQIANAYKRVTY